MLKLKKHHFKFKKNLSHSKHILKNGTIGFKITKDKKISNKQEEFLRLLIIKSLRSIVHRKGKVFFYCNSFFNQTKLPLESRMGKGKGEILYSFSYYKVGYVLFELKGFECSEAIILKNKLNKKSILKFSLIS